MTFMTTLMLRHKHPLTWLYSVLFYLNFCIGLWLHNWLIISSTLTGIVCVTLFQPEIDTVPNWSARLINTLMTEWLNMNIMLRFGLVTVGFAAFFLLIYALWQNSILLTLISLAAIIFVKGYFFRTALSNWLAKR